MGEPSRDAWLHPDSIERMRFSVATKKDLQTALK